MQKKYELISFDNENNFDSAYSLYKALFTELIQEEANFKKLSSPRAFFTTFAQDINSCDVTILAVEKSCYIKI